MQNEIEIEKYMDVFPTKAEKNNSHHQKYIKLSKISFSVEACTSWDDEFTPEELLINNHTPNAKGWQSSRLDLKYAFNPSDSQIHARELSCSKNSSFITPF
ncbi:hypothetical protein HK096_003181 [Nowakowskiella sp. JEL0078]|nr:hypothetical protein HK096_003181 [Nowakowskiella sp. JEL0078]